MIRLKTTKIGLFPVEKLSRVKAFERDLDFYLGKDWMKNYSPRYYTIMLFFINIMHINSVLYPNTFYFTYIYNNLLPGFY